MQVPAQIIDQRGALRHESLTVIDEQPDIEQRVLLTIGSPGTAARVLTQPAQLALQARYAVCVSTRPKPPGTQLTTVRRILTRDKPIAHDH
jgi:hypothetical protein